MVSIEIKDFLDKTWALDDWDKYNNNEDLYYHLDPIFPETMMVIQKNPRLGWVMSRFPIPVWKSFCEFLEMIKSSRTLVK